jgi:hypothetical protein
MQRSQLLSRDAPEFRTRRSWAADETHGQLHRKDKNENIVTLMEGRLQTESEGNGIPGGTQPCGINYTAARSWSRNQRINGLSYGSSESRAEKGIYVVCFRP